MKSDDRDRRLDELLAQRLDGEVRGSWLVAGRLPRVQTTLVEQGASVDRFLRFAVLGEPSPSLIPQGEGYDGAVLRLPRGSDAIDMALHLIAHRLAPHGSLWVGGANDEGGKGIARRLRDLFGVVGESVPGGHARRVCASEPLPGARGELQAWARVDALEWPGEAPRPWVSFPGVFAAGRVDPATALLLGHLPDLAGRRVLDFACGSGVIAAALAARGARAEACDHDVYAVEAARRNLGADVPVVCADGLPAGGPWDVIVSNPPIHAGQARDLGVLSRLVAEVPGRLRPGGSAWFVCQVTVPLADLWADSMRARVVASNGSFKVIEASR